MSKRQSLSIRHGAVAVAVACAAAGGAAGVPQAARAFTPHFKVAVPFTGGRSTDFRVGEPLEFFVPGEKIKRVCWTPAPIGRDRCGTSFGAPAKAGRQGFSITLRSGKVIHEAIQIGPRATRLPRTADASTAPGAHVVEYRATCEADGHATVTDDGHLRGTVAKAQNLKDGDLVAAYYRAGGHAIEAIPYRTGQPAFYFDRCLTPVR
jgi:hypothetical protein